MGGKMRKKNINCGKLSVFNKFMVLGNKSPIDMDLPIVVDLKELQDLLNNIAKKIHPELHLNLRADKIEKGNLSIQVVLKDMLEE
jgi:hypothetical protein